MSDLFKRYSFLQLINLAFNLIRTKIVFKEARLIRFPIDIRGRKYIVIKKGFTTGIGCRFEAYPADENKVLHIGKNVQINDYVHITAMSNVIIGNDVLIASKVYISDCSHGSYSGNKFDSNPNTIPAERKLFSKPVEIKDNAWLGEFVCVLPGVTIGKGTIVGANSVVTKDLPPYVIAVGAPAKPIKKYNFESQRWEKI
jgi:acetyltransferase-like isoleucine patch superfamily enzyme